MTFRTSFCPCVLFMSENCNVIADGLEDKKQSKDCFYVTEWGCVVYDWTEIDRKMYTALDRVSCIFGSGNATYGIIKEDVPTWCKQLYYDFFLIYGLYMFPTFTWPSSGVLIYRLFHCRMWCYAIGVEDVVLRRWRVVLCTVCQYPTCRGHLWEKIIVKLFASSWYIFLIYIYIYIYDARSHCPDWGFTVIFLSCKVNARA